MNQTLMQVAVIVVLFYGLCLTLAAMAVAVAVAQFLERSGKAAEAIGGLADVAVGRYSLNEVARGVVAMGTTDRRKGPQRIADAINVKLWGEDGEPTFVGYTIFDAWRQAVRDVEQR